MSFHKDFLPIDEVDAFGGAVDFSSAQIKNWKGRIGGRSNDIDASAAAATPGE